MAHTVRPPSSSTADPGSYARHTVVDRMPRFIDQVIETNDVDEPARTALRALAREIAGGAVTSPLRDRRLSPSAMEPEEILAWERQIAAYEGRRWLDLPWYFAEAFFYLKVLVAFGCYENGPAAPGGAPSRRDPFLPQKERELLDPHGGLAMAGPLLASAARKAEGDGLAFHLHSALWGNRLDLSTFEVDESMRRNVLSRHDESLIVDHTDEAVSALSRAAAVHVILDNAGPELVCDLLLADRLAPRSIELHAKKAPFYVSDATVHDVLRTIDAMADASEPRTAAAGQRLKDARRAGSLCVRDHWFWNSALHFTALPPDVKGRLQAADVVIIKGDANYRRILEDRKWETSASMEDLAAYFPVPFVSLRTLKSELVVDVPKELAMRISADDPDWMVNGKRGLIRYCRVRGAG